MEKSAKQSSNDNISVIWVNTMSNELHHLVYQNSAGTELYKVRNYQSLDTSVMRKSRLLESLTNSNLLSIYSKFISF